MARQCAAAALMIATLASCSGSGPPVGTVGHVTDYFGGAAADEPRAAIAARDALSAGGSAADAAVAMYFALAVTLPSAAGLAGGGVCVVYDGKTNKAETLDFIARAPSAPVPDGRWAATVPGTVRGMFGLHARYGRLRWEQLVLPAETMARFGIPAPRALVRSLPGAAVLTDPLGRRDFGGADGRGLTEADMLRRFDLAGVLGRIRVGGAGELYTGPLARSYVEGIAQLGGWVTAEDMRAYRPVWRETVDGRFGPHRVHFPPSPAIGGRVAASIWAKLGDGGSLDGVEAMMRLVETAREAYAGAWARPDSGLASAGFLAMDRNGSAVACVVGMNRPFGNGRMVPGLGILAVQPPEDAATALLGMVPMVIANHNTAQPLMAATGAGDGFAPVALATAALHATGGRIPVPQALAAPRAAPSAGSVVVEDGAPPALKAAFPNASEVPALGRVLMMYCPDGTNIRTAVCMVGADPRGHGYAISAER